MILVFSFSMAFKCALANEPSYVTGYLSNMSANNSSVPHSSLVAPLRDLVSLASEPTYGYLSNTNSTASTSVPDSWDAFRAFPPIFWKVLSGMVCTMGAMRCAIVCLNLAVMVQMKALQPCEILLAGEGEVKCDQLWRLLEVVKTVYASKDCIPAACLSLIVGTFLIVGFVEGGVVLAWVLHRGDIHKIDIHKSFAQSPELFLATLGTVVPLALFIVQAANPLVAFNEKIEKCKTELYVIKRDFQKKCAMLQKDGAGIAAAVDFVEQELRAIRPVTLFGIPYSRGSKLAMLLVIPAVQLGLPIFHVVKFLQNVPRHH